VAVLGAGSEPWNHHSDASLFLEGENHCLAVQDSRIAESGTPGVSVRVETMNADISFEHVAFDNNEEPIKTSDADVFTLGEGLTFSSNDDASIRVFPRGLEESETWRDPGIGFALPV
jgi:hypothetical protein